MWARGFGPLLAAALVATLSGCVASPAVGACDDAGRCPPEVRCDGGACSVELDAESGAPADAGADDGGDAGSDAEVLALDGFASLGLRCYDPGAAWVATQGRYVVFCGGQNDTFYVSTDGVRFEARAMSFVTPAWVWSDPSTGRPRVGGWQPAFLDGRWYLYFGGRDATNPVPGQLTPHVSIGVFVVPEDPSGPFFDGMVLHNASDAVFDAPLARRDGFTLQDPYVFQDDDRAIYLYSNQFNSDKSESGIYVSRLDDPATKRCCQRQVLRAAGSIGAGTAVRAWAGTTVEAPAVARVGGRVMLLFSGGLFDDRYGLDPHPYENGIARADAPLGPFVEYPRDHVGPPWYPQLGCARLEAELGGRCVLGPGSGALTADGQFFFNAQRDGEGGRSLYRARVVDAADGWIDFEPSR